jgi:hypothetical protein
VDLPKAAVLSEVVGCLEAVGWLKMDWLGVGGGLAGGGLTGGGGRLAGGGGGLPGGWR